VSASPQSATTPLFPAEPIAAAETWKEQPLGRTRSEPDPRLSRRVQAWANLWVSFALMRSVERHPRLMRKAKPLLTNLAWRNSRYLRTSLLANARRILGANAGLDERTALAKGVLSNVYDFIGEIAGAARMSDDQLHARIAHVHGRDRYLQARSAKRGAILVTAHLGAFETSVAALRRDESRVHIVFQRDPMKRFEAMRAAQRRRLGVIEAPVDDGLSVWMKLRDALLNDEVVLLQGDRVMPGQTGRRMRFLDGHMLFPSGPVKLAQATGAPLIPIFAPRTADGKVLIILEEPIPVHWVDQTPTEPHPSMLQLARIIERYVRQYPDQWLVMHRAFCEDQAARS
jgi:lauroyl/myristoyl acyltransferase